MLSYLFRRALQGVAIVWMVVTLTFILVHAAPGEPFAEILEDRRATVEMRTLLRERYGLDLPVGQQYLRYLTRAASGDLGISLAQQRPVREILGEALPRTLLLMGAALTLGFALGIALGAVQAAKRGSIADRVATRITVTLSAVPDFWLALGLMLVFAVRLRWLPSAGMHDDAVYRYLSPGQRALDLLSHLTLPVASLALIFTAVVSRYQRAALIEVLPDDFVRTARAKGLSERAILFRHALRNAILPILTLVGLSIPSLVGGSVFIETIFSWPGMGKATVDALGQRDYPVVIGAALVASTVVVLSSIIADLLYAASDPRLRRA
ncbi:MAG: ABC transporter permease [Gemmatimonadaceae bacterium]